MDYTVQYTLESSVKHTKALDAARRRLALLEKIPACSKSSSNDWPVYARCLPVEQESTCTHKEHLKPERGRTPLLLIFVDFRELVEWVSAAFCPWSLSPGMFPLPPPNSSIVLVMRHPPTGYLLKVHIYCTVLYCTISGQVP